MARTLILPRYGGRAYLILFDVSSQRYYSFLVKEVRPLASGDVIFVTREGFEITVPIESIVDGTDYTNTNAVYIVFSRSAIVFDHRKRLVRFEPYDTSIVHLAAELGKPTLDAIAEKVSALADAARECRTSLTYVEAGCWLECLAKISEIAKTINSAFEDVMAGKIDEARAKLMERVAVVREGVLKTIESLKNQALRAQSLMEELVKIATRFGIPEEKAREMSLEQLVEEINSMVRLVKRIPEERRA